MKSKNCIVDGDFLTPTLHLDDEKATATSPVGHRKNTLATIEKHSEENLVTENNNQKWTKEEINKIFLFYKLYGTKWSKFMKEFPDRTEGKIKNKFYSLLKKVATQAQLENPTRYDSTFIKCKKNLVQFVDYAKEYGQTLSSKRGRKSNLLREQAPKNAILFPKNPEKPIVRSLPSIFPDLFNTILSNKVTTRTISDSYNEIEFEKLEEHRGFDVHAKKRKIFDENAMRTYGIWIVNALNRNIVKPKLPYPIGFLDY